MPDKRIVDTNGRPLLSAQVAADAAGPVKHYGLVLIENGRVRDQRAIGDPFVKVEIQVSGWRKAWQVLRRRYGIGVRVHGDEQAMRDVFGTHGMIRP